MSVKIINQEQREASDPTNSVWLLASAGTGKTKVLIDRVLKLILTGTDPEKILCLSFTKAAANEIENRLQSILLKWAGMDAHQISINVKSLLPHSNVEIQPKNCLLLAQSISEKFKVYTIHAFCQDLINKFLFELKLKYNTCIINKVQSKAILNIAKKSLLSLPNSEEFNQFKILLKYYSYTQISSIIDKIFENFFSLKQVLYISDNNLYGSNLTNIFSLHSSPKDDEILASYLNNIPQIDLNIVNYKDSTNLDHQKLSLLEKFLSSTPPVQKQTWLSLLSFFLTNDNTKKIRLFSSSFIQNNKELYSNLLAWQDLFLKAYIEIELHNNYKINYAFFVIVKSICARFAQIKKEKGYLDYDDLIYHAQTLLSPNVEKEWTLYKLNNGFDHILIDEAQDTSKEQWKIIQNLVQNLVLNNEARSNKTIFVVGDEKQSIYSFQGANIEHFKKVQEFFQNLITNANQTYKVINLINCYRSSQVILDFVYDAVSFAKSKGKFEVQNIKLTSHKEQSDSYIKLMPLITKNTSENVKNTSYIAAQTLMQQTAKIIALQVFDLLQQKISSPQNTLKAEDIMILVQRRGKLSSSIISECKKLGINITSSGRLFLQDALIIMDIISVAKFVLFAQDNLNLSCLLKSPFFQMKEKDLNDLFLPANEKEQNLLSLLQHSKEKKFQSAYKELCQIQNLYKQTNLLTFFSITANCLEKHVHNMANNILELRELHLLDEFLNVVNNYKSAHENSMQKFVQWFLENPIELNVKNQDTNSVKITTVHGSKGLEAPCVIIADANEVDTLSDDIIFNEDLMLINRKVHSAKTHIINQKKKGLAYQEYLRLMYVAFTRCKDYLIIFGSGSEEKDMLTWYNFANFAMTKESSSTSSKIFEKLGIYSKTFIRENGISYNHHQNSSKLDVETQKNIANASDEEQMTNAGTRNTQSPTLSQNNSAIQNAQSFSPLKTSAGHNRDNEHISDLGGHLDQQDNKDFSPAQNNSAIQNAQSFSPLKTNAGTSQDHEHISDLGVHLDQQDNKDFSPAQNNSAIQNAQSFAHSKISAGPSQDNEHISDLGVHLDQQDNKDFSPAQNNSAIQNAQSFAHSKISAGPSQDNEQSADLEINSDQQTTQNLSSLHPNQTPNLSTTSADLNYSLKDKNSFFTSFTDINLPTNLKPSAAGKTSNSNSLQDGEKVHKLLEKLLNGAQIKDIYSNNLFLSLNAEKQNYIRQFVLSDLYKEILSADQIYTERVLFYSNSSNEKNNLRGKILRIDLLCIKSNTVKIIDYKTDLKPCNNIKEIPGKYLNQILEYKEIVAKIYPTLNVEGYIFWLQNCSSLRVV